MTRLILIPILGLLMGGCAKEKTTEQLIAEEEYRSQIIWECDSRQNPKCLDGIYHFGYKRDGTMFIWRKDDMMPSTVCKPGDCLR